MGAVFFNESIKPLMTSTAASGTSEKTTESRSTRTRLLPRKEAEETAHMNVLGRDGHDLDLEYTLQNEVNDDDASRSEAVGSPTHHLSSPTTKTSGNTALTTAVTTSYEAKNTSNWWGAAIQGWNAVTSPSREEAESDDSNDYQPLETSHSEEHTMSSPARKSIYHPLDPDCGVAPSTVEDRLRQDCSFFYQDIEDPLPNAMGPFTAFTTPRFMSSRDGAMFHAKYQRLNQVFERNTGDVRLVEEPSEPEPLPARILTDVQSSTLFYEQNGRLLLRLPRDQVRLVMDLELEAGIVSVEQWRKEDTTNITPAKASFFETYPPLRYVLTVPDDLYRRVVSEMSDALVPPYYGLFKCCHETEKADLRLALIILFVVFLLIFISTLEWPTE